MNNQGRIMVNYRKGETFEASLEEVFPEGVPNGVVSIKDAAANFFDLPLGALSGFSVRDDRDTTGNILVRPEAVFGKM